MVHEVELRQFIFGREYLWEVNVIDYLIRLRGQGVNGSFRYFDKNDVCLVCSKRIRYHLMTDFMSVLIPFRKPTLDLLVREAIHLNLNLSRFLVESEGRKGETQYKLTPICRVGSSKRCSQD